MIKRLIIILIERLTKKTINAIYKKLNIKFVNFRIYGNLWEKKESSDMMFIFDPQCHTLVTFFLNLPMSKND